MRGCFGVSALLRLHSLLSPSSFPLLSILPSSSLLPLQPHHNEPPPNQRPQPLHLPPPLCLRDLWLPRRPGHIPPHRHRSSRQQHRLPLQHANLLRALQHSHRCLLRYSPTRPTHESHRRRRHRPHLHQRRHRSSRPLRRSLHPPIQRNRPPHALRQRHPHPHHQRNPSRRRPLPHHCLLQLPPQQPFLALPLLG